MNADLNDAPYNKVILFTFDSELIHSGIKVLHQTYNIYRGERTLIKTITQYDPADIHATYDGEAYFPTDPIGWCELPEIEIER